MRTVEWGPPPADRRRWGTILEPLTERPGEWARVLDLGTSAETVRNAKRHLQSGRARDVDPVEWEFVGRKIGANEWGLWARYLGERP